MLTISEKRAISLVVHKLCYVRSSDLRVCLTPRPFFMLRAWSHFLHTTYFLLFRGVWRGELLLCEDGISWAGVLVSATILKIHHLLRLCVWAHYGIFNDGEAESFLEMVRTVVHLSGVDGSSGTALLCNF